MQIFFSPIALSLEERQTARAHAEDAQPREGGQESGSNQPLKNIQASDSFHWLWKLHVQVPALYDGFPSEGDAGECLCALTVLLGFCSSPSLRGLSWPCPVTVAVESKRSLQAFPPWAEAPYITSLSCKRVLASVLPLPIFSLIREAVNEIQQDHVYLQCNNPCSSECFWCCWLASLWFWFGCYPCLGEAATAWLPAITWSLILSVSFS